MRTPKPGTPGARLRAARLKDDLTIMDLAVLADLSRSHVNKMELGDDRGGLSAWQSLATALGVSIDSLLGGEVIADDEGVSNTKRKREFW